MERSREEPLGVPEAHGDQEDERERTSISPKPNALDRWLVHQLTSRLDGSRVRVVLWDEPRARGDGPLAHRRTHRLSQGTQTGDPPIPTSTSGDLYAAGRITVPWCSVDRDPTRPTSLRLRRPRRLAKLLRGRKLPTARPRRLAAATSHHHYDLGNDFYQLWLEPGSPAVHLRVFRRSLK